MIRDSVIDWQELSGLYERADVLDESALAVFLGQLRSEKHRLLAQLERMLDARSRIATSTFLEVLPRIETLPSPLPSEWAEGSRIGAYRLIRHIGSGGMAEVWLAERADGAFERQVAIKLLFNHPTRAQRDSFVERFKRERDILASLHHPNIAGLHDAGVTPGGQPWLAIEVVEGEPITAWCEAGGLTIEARVAVFRQVLLAVEYAHANLVIHRDLKPSNILVTGQGEVKLLDFGIAKLIEGDGQGLADTELTRQMGRPLTVLYASPEQVEGKSLTTASDVYSAGVVLYELVTGRRPYDVTDPSPARLAAAIISVDPMPPSRRAPVGSDAKPSPLRQLGRAAAGDLDAVVMKALAKEPANRYHSAEAMRTDLGRWTEHRPVEAQVPSVAYRARRFMARHKFGVSLASGAIAALLAVTTTAVVLGAKARAESERAISARNFVQDMFRVADPDQIRGDEITARSILARGRVNAEQMFAAQPVLLGEVLSTIGDMQVTIGDHADADGTLQRALALFLQEGLTRSAALGHAAVSFNAIFLGDIERASRSIDAAERLTSAFQGDDELQGRILLTHAWVLNAAGRNAEGRDLLLQSARRIDAWNRTSEVAVEVLQALANADLALGDIPSAASWIEDAERRAGDDPRIGPRTRIKTAIQRSRLDSDAGRYGALVQHLARLIPDCDRRLGALTEECLILRRRFVVSLLRTGRTAEAVDVATQLRPSLLADGSPRRVAESAFVIAQALAAAGKSSSQPELAATLQRLASAKDQSATYRTIASTTLAEMALLEGDDAAATTFATDATAEQSNGTIAPIWIARARLLQGLSLQHQGNHAAALKRFDEADEAFAASWGREHPRTVLFRLNAIASLRATGNHEPARRACQDASKILDSALGATSPATRRIAEFCSPGTASTVIERFL